MPLQNEIPDNRQPERPSDEWRHTLGWAAAAVLGFAVIGTFAYSQHQRQQMDEMWATNRTLNASLTQIQEQLQSVTDRLNRRIEEDTARVLSPPAAAPAAVRRAAAPRPAAPVAPPAPLKDPRFDQLQGQLADQQKALASTRDDLAGTRTDLENTRADLQGKLDSNRDDLNNSIGRTRDELNGSIAHTHDELLALQKRGERNYFEFSINKSKQFEKVGPVSLELRKVDYKHKSYDVEMLVDDFTLQKKKINLFEPVWINLTDTPEPAELIVNKIDKDKIAGYIAAPKYRKSELDRTSSASAAAAPTVQ